MLANAHLSFLVTGELTDQPWLCLLACCIQRPWFDSPGGLQL